MRPTLLLVLLTVAGCDAASDTLTPYDGIVEVSLVVTEPPTGPVEDLALRLVAVEDTGCGNPLVTELERGSATRSVTVEGIRVPDGPQCLALIPASAVVALELGPELPGGYLVEVRHAGAADRYSLDLSGPAPILTAVRTSTTRLAAD